MATRLIPALLAAGLLGLAGCSARPAVDVPAHPATGPDFTAADVMFLQMMVPHHEQGRTVARLAADRSSRAEIRTLAAAIDATQADEVAIMAGWLRDWRQPATAPAGSHGEHGGMPNTTAGEIAALGRISGPDFDRRFLNAMIAHQDDAIQLAKMEVAGGTSPKARALAERIDRSRSAQIDQMLALLGQA